MGEARTFYKPLMKAGKGQFQIGVPQSIVQGLGAVERDELEVIVRLTGKNIPKKENAFGKKE